jgi:hypothetical protein
MGLSVGDVVTVLLDCGYKGKQGEVVAVVHDRDEDGPVVVRFDKHDHFRYFGPDDKVPDIRFQESDLRRDQHWSIEVLARRLFNQMWHSLQYFKDPLDPTKACMHEGCDQMRSRRIAVNIWGTVCEADVCDQHSERYHGKMVELFPWRKAA